MGSLATLAAFWTGSGDQADTSWRRFTGSGSDWRLKVAGG